MDLTSIHILGGFLFVVAIWTIFQIRDLTEQNDYLLKRLEYYEKHGPVAIPKAERPATASFEKRSYTADKAG